MTPSLIRLSTNSLPLFMVFPVPGRVRVSRALGEDVRDLLAAHALWISCDLAWVTKEGDDVGFV